MTTAALLAGVGTLVALLYYFLIQPLFLDPLRQVPGPATYSLTRWRLALDEWNGKRTRRIDDLHRRYGLVVRVGPGEVHFNSLTALRTIYGSGSGFERTDFYRLFDAYGKPNMFSFGPARHHARRRKLLAKMYAKSSVLAAPLAGIVEGKAAAYLDLVDGSVAGRVELFSSLHYYAIDSVSHVIFGSGSGATSCMAGEPSHQSLLNDVFDPARRQLIWFSVHLPKLVGWMYTRRGLAARLVRPLLPMKPPTTYSGIRALALEAWQSFHATAKNGDSELAEPASVMEILFQHHVSQPGGHLEDLDIASECADHLLAGVDTTANTLLFLVWALSLPENQHHQAALIKELREIPEDSVSPRGVPSARAADKMPYLNAVVKETLRLYAPLPSTQPRSCPVDSVIDGYSIPAGTVVGMAPYSLHRNERVFAHPRTFSPERWLDDGPEASELNRWFWVFSSGGRQCLGNNLAMAEMTTLVAAIYRNYATAVEAGCEHLGPVITSRFELFYDEGKQHMKEHDCWVRFRKRE